LPYGVDGVERQPEGVPRTPDETIAEAQRLLDEGKPFHAHEVFEDAWKAADEPERALWRGLAQLAVGMTHAARGNEAGAASLLQRGADNIWPYEVSRPYGIDIAGLLKWVEAPSGVPRLR
jgi:predicted metal-dependent hydrolase